MVTEDLPESKYFDDRRGQPNRTLGEHLNAPRPESCSSGDTKTLAEQAGVKDIK